MTIDGTETISRHHIVGEDLTRSVRGSSLDVRIIRLKTIPALKELKKYNGRRPITHLRANLDIYDDLKLKKPFGLHGLYKNISDFKG